ncbi:hypothetical protein [Streptomyces chryseus]
MARGKGDHTPSDVARRLHVARTTAWRLFNGHSAPSPSVAHAVQLHYRIEIGALLIPATQAKK